MRPGVIAEHGEVKVPKFGTDFTRKAAQLNPTQGLSAWEINLEFIFAALAQNPPLQPQALRVQFAIPSIGVDTSQRDTSTARNGEHPKHKTADESQLL